MNKLSSRLESIYNLVDNNQITLDVGCDHGLLSIALVKNNKSDFAYACDINQNALNQAIKNIEKDKLNNITTILADGTNIDDINKITTLLISGLGSDTIINILNRDISILPKNIIICSNNNYYDIRKHMSSLGYIIDKEIISKDRNKFYIAIKFIKSTKLNSSNLYLPKTIKDELYIEYMNHLINSKTTLYNSIPKKYLKKRYKLKKIINIYKKSIK